MYDNSYHGGHSAVPSIKYPDFSRPMDLTALPLKYKYIISNRYIYNTFLRESVQVRATTVESDTYFMPIR